MDLPVDFLSHSETAPDAVGNLLDLCFGPARQKRTASILRKGAERIEDASFVAMDGVNLIGSVETWLLDLQHASGRRPIALLGPLVSHPERRGERIGMRLMDLALAELDKLKLPVLLIGDEPYYGRWGFSATHTGKWQLPGPVDRHRLLLRARDAQRLGGHASLASPVTTERAA
ncbi:GNAT family N-acetyltransferase [Sandaracinobacteroides hominis]|uniref:GNAT family N-acetyltransferase n=1 Tax=Sandaracinobacteroides hominis TaxID=2780086 RepID=UPI0018F3850E|nr:N-acetyltransferase [Sandaracinobacteroides hominis]